MLLASVAPQRVHVPQVEVGITPSTCGLELRAYFHAELAGVGYGRAVADGTVEHMVELADFAFLFQIAQHVDGQDAVRVRIGIGLIVAAVGVMYSPLRRSVTPSRSYAP